MVRASGLQGAAQHKLEISISHIGKVPPPSQWPFAYEMLLICGSAFVASWTVGALPSEASRERELRAHAVVPRVIPLSKACLPMLAELAPWGRKSGILAWQGALEGAFGCMLTSSMEVTGLHV
ncbi:unnamed protein product [Symbiodinium natans]|uniref:Uncharacterized protein n=1 Tax=Symbiodinium natans TaxID=878477 RepID=A0A812J4R4_9DINO|nr:unnamed protein product [Symbiodinium natans]